MGRRRRVLARDFVPSMGKEELGRGPHGRREVVVPIPPGFGETGAAAAVPPWPRRGQAGVGIGGVVRGEYCGRKERVFLPYVFPFLPENKRVIDEGRTGIFR